MRIKIDKVQLITIVATIGVCYIIDGQNADKNKSVDVSSLMNMNSKDINEYVEEIELEKKSIQDFVAQVTEQIGTESIQQEKVSIPEDWISLKDMDIEALENVMKTQEYTALMEYMELLDNKTAFKWMPDMGASNTMQVTIDKFCHELNKDTYEVDDLWINSLAVCDLTRDGKYELILSLKNVGNEYLILHKEGLDFYGVSMIYRGFEDVRTNGIYIGSGGAAYTSYHQLCFENERFTEKLLGHTDYDFINNVPIFYIGEELVEEAAFYEWTDNIMSECVQFYEPNKSV